MKRAIEPKRTSPPGRPIIERPRLIRRLDDAKSRTVLLVAPAGYGKTTLLRQWAQRHPELCWHTAGTGSSDPAQLAIGLARSFERVSPGLTEYVAQVLGALANPSRQVVDIADALASVLAGAPKTTTVIDDYHLIGESHSAETFVRELRERLDMRLFIGTRTRPEWASARDELYGDIVEIGPGELALTQEEEIEVLSTSSGTVTPDLLTRANGWPAVIGLAALARPTTRTPEDAASATLFRFFAEELFNAAPEALRQTLPNMALLPSLSRELTAELYGAESETLLDAAVIQGFATLDGSEHELHPLIREYLLSKLGSRADVEQQVTDAVALSLRLDEWDHAFALITRFDRADLLESLVEAAFKPLVRSGRIGTLEQIAAFARSRSADFSPLITLIDAELAFRDGHFTRAKALGAGAADNLGPAHVLTSEAHWVAGQGANLTCDYAAALHHFTAARDSAIDDAEARDATWGLAMTSLYSESSNPMKLILELQEGRNSSPTALLRATTALLTHRRFHTGFAEPIDVETAKHALSSVSDPRVRTSFTNVLTYELLLKAEYREAAKVASIMRKDAGQYRLTWIVPHADWALGIAALGMREFARARRLFARVAKMGRRLDDGHLIHNAAIGEARVLLSLHRAQEALQALCIDETQPTNRAMKAELIATRGLIKGVMGLGGDGLNDAEQAERMTSSVDVRALVACCRAVCTPSRAASIEAFARAERLGVWDSFVCTIRAEPRLLADLSSLDTHAARIRGLLLRCNDFDLARSAGITLGLRPHAGRSPLSPREREVHELVSSGLTNKEIARALFISEGTAKVHVSRILAKTGSRTRAEAAAKFDDTS